MKITILCDNETDSSAYLTEHGFSCWIETKDRKDEPVKILFDTGKSDIFLTNAARKGIDVRANRYTVISHGHYDHGGGLAALFKEAPHSHIYLGKGAFDAHLEGEEGEKYYFSEKNIGLPPKRLKENKSRFTFIEKETILEEGIELLPASPLTYPMPPNTGLCEVDGKGRLRKDSFTHEIYLTIREGNELYLFTGCAHRGIANIAAYAETRYPGLERYTVIGGFHIKNDREDGQITLLKDLIRGREEKWRFLTGHCSGTEKMKLLEESVSSPVSYTFAGTEFSL